MVEGFICEYNDKGGLLLQKGQRVEGLLIKNRKVQGVRAKLPFSFLSPATKTGEGERAAPAALGVRWRSEEWGKERGHHGKLIPGRGSSGGGPWELGHGGGRRQATAAVVAP